MKVYHFCEHTGEYLGESDADPDPLLPVLYLLPAHATFVEPQATPAKWNGQTWVVDPPPPAPAQAPAITSPIVTTGQADTPIGKRQKKARKKKG